MRFIKSGRNISDGIRPVGTGAGSAVRFSNGADIEWDIIDGDGAVFIAKSIEGA